MKKKKITQLPTESWNWQKEKIQAKQLKLQYFTFKFKWKLKKNSLLKIILMNDLTLCQWQIENYHGDGKEI